MHLVISAYLAYVLTALLALVHLTSANFDLYVVRGEKDTVFPWPDDIGGWIIHKYDYPTCEDIDAEDQYEHSGWSGRNDLSHGRIGVRCEPSDHCGVWHLDDNPWPSVQVVEMHFTNHPLYHWTIYKDRGHQDGDTWMWPMYGVDGGTYGNCLVFTGQTFGTCSWNDGHRRMWGQRKFRCLTKFGANEIKEAHRKEPGKGLIPAMEIIVHHNATDVNATAVAWKA